MGKRRRWTWLWWLLGLAVLLAVVALAVPRFLNRYQDEGALTLPGVKKPVTVVRDEKGMAYIRAGELDDAVMALGFVTAQDRLFQMELTKLFACGRICELAGEKARALDTRMRTIGFRRNAARHARILDSGTRRYFQKYIDGVNAYITNRKETHPIEFRLAGLDPEPWTLADSLAIFYYMSWDTAANLETEIVAGMLVDKLGLERARDLFPLNVNPDDPATEPRSTGEVRAWEGPLPINSDGRLMALLGHRRLEVGSNNWAVGPEKGRDGHPIVADDPHLDARILPGPWYPAGLITPRSRIVGVHIPGLPAIPIMRTEHIAVGITNAYGDAQDLYVETLDPRNRAHYLEGDRSVPFDVVEETLRIRDKEAEEGFREETILVRSTNRGPVVSGVLSGLERDRVVTLRWAPFETMAPSLGFLDLLDARSVWEVQKALSGVNAIMLNFVFADREGNVGWHASGRLPVRSIGDGTVPLEVTSGEDNWSGWIPFDDMPHLYNPSRGWVGTCNHAVARHDDPYYYSSHQSPSYRYRRLKELLDPPGPRTAEDHWAYQRDTKNIMAERLAPVLAGILKRHDETRGMGGLLERWDFRDDPAQAAPTVFHALYERLALLTFLDELGEDRARKMLRVWYFWQERFQRMIQRGDAVWFDDTSTKDRRETLDDLVLRAARDVRETWEPELGEDLEEWLWGRVHRVEFVSPIRREGPGKGLVGGGSHGAPGSVEALCRGFYDFNEPFDVTVFASLRMVADLKDPDKILAVLPGGVAGRLFHPHSKDQIEPYMRGDKVYWWFSDKAIQDHAEKTLTLAPGGDG